MRTVYLLFMILSVVGCDRREMPAGEYAYGPIVTDRAEQDQISKKLESYNIPHEFDESGGLKHMLHDHAQVLGVVRHIEYGEIMDPNFYGSIVLINKTIQDMYTNEFERKNIPFHIETHNGVVHLYSSQRFAPQVDIIRQKVITEIRQNASSKR